MSQARGGRGAAQLTAGGAHVDLSPGSCHMEVGTLGGPRASASSSVDWG